MKLSQQQIDELTFAEQRLRESMALHLASLGMKIFPMKPNRKEPGITGWPKNASSDSDQIKAWFRQFPDMNYGIACGPSGLAVVDLDVKHGIDGIASWQRHELEVGPIPTFEVHTPSGGLHLYYWANDIPSTTNYPSKAIDIRGEGGCVVGPGSTLPNGTYLPSLPKYFPDTQDISTASEPLKALLGSGKASESLALGGVLAAPGVPASKPLSNLQAEVLGRNIAKLLAAQEGQRNATLNECAFVLGVLVREGAIDRTRAEILLLNASKSIGLSETESKATIESGLTGGALKGDSLTPGKSKYVALDLLQWLSEDHPQPEPIGSGGIIYAPALIWVMGEPASGKSFLCLKWALDVMDAGKSVVWLDEEAGPGDTVLKLRTLGATDLQLKKQFKYLPPENRSLQIEALELRQFVEDNKPGLIVMDSAAALLANADINENDNSPVGAFMNKAVLPLVKELEIPTIVIDHKTKNNVNSSYARGASSKLGVVDLALNVDLKVSFSKEQSGSFEVKVNKDRAGIHAKDKSWQVQVDVNDGNVRLSFGEPKTTQVGKSQESDIGPKICEFVSLNPGASKNLIETSITGYSNQKIRDRLKQLMEDGDLVSKQNGKIKGIFLANPPY